MCRFEELFKSVENDETLKPLIEQMVYLEGELETLKKLPKYKIHPNDPTRQKITVAGKLYKEYLQQYINVVKVVVRITGIDESEEDSPLRDWMRKNANSK